jgi:hypothetical protein
VALGGVNTLTALGIGGGATIVGFTWLIGGGGAVITLGNATGGGGTIPPVSGIFGMAAVGSKTRGGSLVMGFKTGATGVNGLTCTGWCGPVVGGVLGNNDTGLTG